MRHERISTPRIGDTGGLREARRARRRVLAAALAGAALAGVPWRVGAQARTPTPRQTAGPFYPEEFPADGDNDLVQVKGQSGRAARSSC